MAAATDLRRPLLPSSAGSHPTHTISDQTPPPQHIITIKDHVGFPQSGTPTNQDSIFLPTQFRFDADLTRNQENPYGVLGSDGFEAPRSTTVDPFRNQTPKIEGVYEWVKMLVCVPIVLVRLVLFGLCLLIGYVATKTALHGWKNNQNPMPSQSPNVINLDHFSKNPLES